MNPKEIIHTHETDIDLLRMADDPLGFLLSELDNEAIRAELDKRMAAPSTTLTGVRLFLVEIHDTNAG